MPTGHESDEPSHRYDAERARDIELRWQAWWDEHRTYETTNPVGPGVEPGAGTPGRKLFLLDMFPYPSGEGLHVGHPLGYIGTDVHARFQRMSGRTLLYTMGFDEFGLPAEQYAAETGQHPRITTERNVANYRRQLGRLGIGHDPRRRIGTSDPAYYRWTQWIFKQIFNAWYDGDADDGAGRARPISELIDELESGERAVPGGRKWKKMDVVERAEVIDARRLAYVAEAPVNWCPGLGTVVANEEVTTDGRSDRGNFPVFQRDMRQWMMRITAYADRLIDDLDLLEWPESIKTMQRNWIGRSVGSRVFFETPADEIEVFTTRADTFFGATFIVLAPEHPMVAALTTGPQAPGVVEYKREAASRKDTERTDDTQAKSGVFTGSYALNPFTGKEIPIWVADYVLMGYGTGAITGVPCGDQRDFEFARNYGLDIVPIQQPPDEWFETRRTRPTLDTERWPEAFVGDAPYVNSNGRSLQLDGIATVAEGIAATNEWLEANGRGEATVTYRLRDWLFSRQRYWGEPFPIVFDADGIAHAVPDDTLPVELPETDQFSPRTFDPDDADSDPESPLDRVTDWVTVRLDIGDGEQEYRRETNVMPQWAGSCWYQLRYCDPDNDEAFVDPELERFWVGPQTNLRPDHPGGVDLYVGGVEHGVLHLLYARFWHKVLYDLGHLSSKEPYSRLYNQGYILAAAYKDARGIYVDAAGVQVDGDAFEYDGSPVDREFGKMGKSLKNAVSPEEMYERYGADTLRLHLMATGPLDASRPWETRDVIGMYRFLQRLWRNVVDEDTGASSVTDDRATEATRTQLHRTIAAVRDGYEHLRVNVAIAKLVELNNHLTKLGATPREVAEPLVLMVAPVVPHIAEELWRILGHDDTLAREPFPVADADFLVDDVIELPVQVNGKVRARITVAADADDATVTSAALADDKVTATIDGATPRKVIVVPGRMVNVVV
jgi:leucyl-tRNA synthetase